MRTNLYNLTGQRNAESKMSMIYYVNKLLGEGAVFA